jgi:TPR repeat protein
MYNNGYGTPTDKKQAKYWIKQASENGSQDAKRVLDDLEL